MSELETTFIEVLSHPESVEIVNITSIEEPLEILSVTEDISSHIEDPLQAIEPGPEETELPSDITDNGPEEQDPPSDITEEQDQPSDITEEQDQPSDITEEQDPPSDILANGPEETEPLSDGPELYLEDVRVDTNTVENENITICVEPAEPTLPTEPPNTVVDRSIPKLVFIVPYRDRPKHHAIFSSNMKTYLEDAPAYKILYIHQTDQRGFNRGAMKNIGYLVVRNEYPDDYKNITLVFNDIDTMPTNKIRLDYETRPGTIKHFYGFTYTLGGIVSVNAGDFESLNGFPNFWAWGFEDNLLQMRAESANIKIDRTVFYKIHDPNIIHLSDTPIREVNRTEFDRYLNKTPEGISSIHSLQYQIDEEPGFVNVTTFETSIQEKLETRKNYDVRNGPAPFKPPPPPSPFYRRASMKMHF